MSDAPDKKGTNQASDSAKPLDDDSLDGVVGGVGGPVDRYFYKGERVSLRDFELAREMWSGASDVDRGGASSTQKKNNSPKQ